MTWSIFVIALVVGFVALALNRWWWAVEQRPTEREQLTEDHEGWREYRRDDAA